MICSGSRAEGLGFTGCRATSLGACLKLCNKGTSCRLRGPRAYLLQWALTLRQSVSASIATNMLIMITSLISKPEDMDIFYCWCYYSHCHDCVCHAYCCCYDRERVGRLDTLANTGVMHARVL